MALYPDDISGLSNRKPDRGFSQGKQYLTSDYQTQTGYEKRRLLSRRPKREYSLSYTNISSTLKEALESFYDSMGGSYSTFSFDLSHVGEAGIIRVKFSNPIRITHVATINSSNIYTITAGLIEDFN